MQIKKIFILSVASCLSMSVLAASAQSAVTTMNLWQRNSCSVDGVKTGDVDLMNGGPKTVTCVWEKTSEPDAGMQMTLHSPFKEINAHCTFTPAANSFDSVASIVGDKAALISVKSLNPPAFLVTNNVPGQNMNVRFLLNQTNKAADKVGRYLNLNDDVDYTAGDSITCTFTPLAPIKG